MSEGLATLRELCWSLQDPEIMNVWERRHYPRTAPQAVEEAARKRDAIAQEILDILMEHPEFCIEHFPGRDRNFRLADFTPLSLFVAMEMGLQLIQQVYNLNPDAIRDSNGNMDLCPLQIACIAARQGQGPVARMKAQVIAFLVREYPDALQRRGPGSRGEYPLLVMLKLPAKIQNHFKNTIRSMIELYPDALDGYKDRYGNTPLGMTIRWDLGEEIFQLLLERTPQNLQVLQLKPVPEKRGRSGTLLHAGYTRELVRLLHRLSKVEIKCHGWTVEGLICFLDHLRSSEFDEVQLALPFGMVCTSPQIREVLAACTTGIDQLVLSRCHLEGRATQEEATDEEILHTVVSGAQPLQKLEIDYLILSSVSCFMDCLSGSLVPKKVTIRTVRFLSTEPAPTNTQEASLSNGSIECLALRVSRRIGGDDNIIFESLVYQLAKLPSLRQLDLQRVGERFNVNLQESLEYLIVTAPKLQSLKLINFNCNGESAIRALRRNNTTLESLVMSTNIADNDLSKLKEKFYDLLSNDNLTLNHLWIGKGEPKLLEPQRHPTRALYHMTLNRWGRSKARNPRTTMSEWVTMLLAASGAPPVAQQVSILYGLLRELPENWCGNESVLTNKRKRSD